MRVLVLLISLSFLSAPAIAGEPRGTTIIEYYGPHPIDPGVNGGLCLIEGPHMHSYRPHDEVLYVNDGPYWTFVGDPTEFEPVAAPARPRHSYYGHHPVWWTHGPGEHYCYITGPHHHGHAPAREVQFVERGGAHWYVGSHPGWYERRKRKHDMDGHYHRHAIARPVVTVEPPSGWIGVRLGGGAAIGIELGAPAVVVPMGVIHIDDHHHHRPKWKHKDKYKHKNKHKSKGKYKYKGKYKGKHK